MLTIIVFYLSGNFYFSLSASFQFYTVMPDKDIFDALYLS